MSEKIFERLREERKRLNKTQEEFAAIAGVTRVPFAVWERGGGPTPAAQNLAAMAQAGADVLYILTGQRSQALAEVELLPPDERVLVDAYRNCNAQARQALIQTAALLSAGMGAPSKPVRASKSVKVGGSVSGNAVVVAGAVSGGIANGRKK
jgi:transcriptional regulator with XRE-family HTH domain